MVQNGILQEVNASKVKANGNCPIICMDIKTEIRQNLLDMPSNKGISKS